jgi:hypothetical protein
LVEPLVVPPINFFDSVIGFVDKTLVITELEVRRLRHDFTELVARAIQPALWLLLFGEVFTKVRAISTGDVPYIDFMAPGILAQSVLFVAIFYGIGIIDHLCAGAAAWCQDELASRGANWRADHRHPRRGDVLDRFADHRVISQDPRTLHGHGSDPHHAAVFRQQRDLSHLTDADLAADHFAH